MKKNYSQEMKLFKKTLKIIGITLLSLILLIISFIYIISPGTTTRFNNDGTIIENSIAEMKFIEIGGVDQFILIRGKSKNNPILLVLHGGPGSPELPMFREFNSKLEEYYTVVHWEQRGAGKSFNKNIPETTMTLEQFIEDTHELTSYLKKEFKQDKIFLLGHSWGSFLGINTVYKYPNDYYVYIGLGQVADQSKSEKLSYQFVLQKAQEENNLDALEDLNTIGEYSEESIRKHGLMKWLMTQREWVMKYGGTTYNPDDVIDLFFKPLLFCEEYSLVDKISFFNGSKLSLISLFPTVLKTSLSETVPEIKIPVYIMQGINDKQTDYSVAKDYFDVLKAPKKEFITFNKSAHLLPFEEPEKFHDIMINRVLKESEEN